MKALVLFSGGLDSSVCLGLAVKKYGADEVLALSVNYGQKHRKEIAAAERVAAFYGVKRITLDLGEIFKDSSCTLLEGSSGEIPHEEYAAQLEKSGGAPVTTYVPFRNGLFLSSAAAVALSHGCSVIYYGAHADDAAGNAYPDTSAAFNRAISDAIYIGSGNELRIEAPFIDQPKSRVVAVGAELGVPFELTWSCYEGHEKACGVCGTCRDRLAAFALNGMKDPLAYEETDFEETDSAHDCEFAGVAADSSSVAADSLSVAEDSSSATANLSSVTADSSSMAVESEYRISFCEEEN